ncbi:MAG: hypothetical protein IJH07_01315 [Ruminococcus sp.]|nr:hypothetical protein [Ruminococcus sp.]
MKRILAILIAVLLLIGALPISAYAADTDTANTGVNIIRRVEVTVTAPRPGMAPSYEATVPSGKGYEVKAPQSGEGWLVYWRNANATPLADGEVFEDGKNIG